MSEEITSKLTPLLNKNRAYVKGADLQVHVPGPDKLEKGGGFKNVLGQYVDQVNTLQHEADAEVQRLVSGETEDLHEAMIAMEEAKTSFEMMMEIRNKLVDAYKQLGQMQ